MPADRALLILIVSVAVLTATVVLFTVGVLLLRARNERVARAWEDAHARWRFLLMDVLSGDAEPDQLLQQVAKDEQARFVEFLAEFSRRLRGEEQQKLADIARPLWPHIERFLTSRHAEVRAQGVQLASALGGLQAEKHVAPALDDSAPLVNMVAARALAARKSHGFLQTILVRTSRFEEVDLRYLSTMLAGVGTAAVKTLRNTFRDPRADAYARAVAADALKRMRDLSSGDLALQVLATTNDRELQMSALRLLAEVGTAEHARAALKYVAAEDAAVRAAAVAAVGRIGTLEDVGQLERCLTDGSPWVVLRAANAIMQLGGASAVRSAAERVRDPAVEAELRMMLA